MIHASRGKPSVNGRAWILPLMLWLALFPVSAVTANEDPNPWQEAYSEDGRIHMRYRLFDQPTGGGSTEPVLEYQASFVGRFDLAQSLARLEDVKHLKYIEEVEQADILQRISASQRLIYFASEGRWPFPGVDSVLRMTRTVSQDSSRAVIELVAAPNAMEDRGHKRMSLYSVTYELEQKPNGELEVKVHSKKAPPFKVPRFLLKSVLPNGGLDQMDRVMEVLDADP